MCCARKGARLGAHQVLVALAADCDCNSGSLLACCRSPRRNSGFEEGASRRNTAAAVADDGTDGVWCWERQKGKSGREVREVREVEVVIECLTRAVKRKRSKEDARGQTVHGGGRTRKIDARVNGPPRGGGQTCHLLQKGDKYYLLTPSSTCDIYYCHFLSVCLLVYIYQNTTWYIPQ